MSATTAGRRWRPPPFIANPWLRLALYGGVALYLALALGTLQVNWGRVAEGLVRGWAFVAAFGNPAGEGGVGLGGGLFEAVARGEAVAEEDDRAGFGGPGGRWAGGEAARQGGEGKREQREREKTKWTAARSHAGFCVVRVFRGRFP